MSKLFVAVDLPVDMTEELALIRPAPVSGVRVANPREMHLTLHYIGNAGVESTASALATVAGRSFYLDFRGVGLFPSAGGSITLWAGVTPSAGLLELHTAVAAALAPSGFKPESRPYTPHITLARCSSGVAPRVVEEFMAQNEGFVLSTARITEFSLYSSSLVGDIPHYRRERSFRLSAEKGT